ncbi:hypothetical protein Scep_018379 [Stephania cephalantha]|uniref:RNase H type-1 domain-containing protein n=1 Tax=Stephania cephalantha TaxID=152367 RepID=A0AAP0ITI5_9MAGN
MGDSLWYTGRKCWGCQLLPAALWGMLYGLHIAKEKRYAQPILESDSTDAVELVTSPSNTGREDQLVMEIKKLLRERENFKVNHIFRECNLVGESSSSTSVSSQQDVEDDRMIAVVLSEEYAKLDNAVAGRLSNLAPIPHVPRINSFIPKLSDASLDYQRLLQRLNVYGLYEVKVSGDGNCQFRALSDQMYRSPEHHKHMPLFSTNQGRNIGYSELSSTAMRRRMVGFGSVGVYFDMELRRGAGASKKDCDLDERAAEDHSSDLAGQQLTIRMSQAIALEPSSSEATESDRGEGRKRKVKKTLEQRSEKVIKTERLDGEDGE